MAVKNLWQGKVNNGEKEILSKTNSLLAKKQSNGEYNDLHGDLLFYLPEIHTPDHSLAKNTEEFSTKPGNSGLHKTNKKIC